MAASHLYLHTSNRVENLAARLVEIASQSPLSHPLAQQTVMTLNPGVARWLQFEIARQTGVSFGWDFPLPGKLFTRVLRGFEPGFDRSGAFPESSASWQLHELLGRLEPQARFEQVRAYCNAPGATRRLSFARRLTKLYDEYLVYRPDTIVQWEDSPDESAFDWQAELWRRLKKAVYPDRQQGRHIARVWHDLRRGQLLELNQDPRQWPERLFVFGVSALAPLYLDFLDQLSKYRPVHIFLLQPSDLYWADLKTSKQIQKIAKKATSKSSKPPQFTSPEDWLFDTGNPLLPALGKQGQMFLDLLIDKNPLQDDAAFLPPDPGYSQLSCLQSDLFAIEDRDLAKGSQALPDTDGTLQIHSCSSRRREVETAWDLIVDRLEKEPELAPSSILVMAPDIQAYRSHIEAVFEAKRGTELEIPYSIADNSASKRPGVLSGLLALLQTVSRRATSNEIIELMETPLIREAFNFSDQDLERIEFWIRELGITWGWDLSHRESHDSFPTDRNTWKEFRVRLLAGIAFSHEAATPAGFLAYPELEGDFSHTAARALECLELVFDLRQAFAQNHPLVFWQKKLLGLLNALRCDNPDWQASYQQATSLVLEALPDLPNVFATGAEALQTLIDSLSETPSGGGYLSGGVTFCSLKPMRAIPADTVILLGMNRLDFPRRSNRLSFDLMARESRIGDRNTREEDRQFFLETLLSVRSYFFITYQGTSSTSDSANEPSVVIEELLHYLKKALAEAEFQKLFFQHKRQSFDRVYFEKGRFFTYDPQRAALRNRFYATEESRAVRANVPEPETNDSSDTIADFADLESLILFYQHPAKTFAVSTAKLRMAYTEDVLEERDKLFSDGLDRYQLRDTFASCIARGEPLESLSRSALAQRKLLPTGRLEEPTYQLELEKALVLANQVGQEPTASYYASHESGELTISGEVSLRQCDGRQIIVYSGDMKANRVLDSWIRHLFASLSVPDFSGETWVFSLHEKAKAICFGQAEGAREIWSSLVENFQAGQLQPLPLFGEVSRAFAKTVQGVDSGEREQAVADALAAATRSLELSKVASDFPKNFDWDPFYQICFGSDYQPDALFQSLSESVWSPCLAAMQNLSGKQISGGVGA